MRHRVQKMHLNRDYDSRRALKRGLMRSFLLKDFIVTTQAKIKFMQPEVEKLVKWAKVGDVNSRRFLISILQDKQLVEKLISGVSVFSNRSGGYTKFTNLKRRVGDNAIVSKLEWVEKLEDVKKKEKKATVQNEKIEDKKPEVAKDTVKENVKKEKKVKERKSLKKAKAPKKDGKSKK